jgi:hypothetical protein
MNTCLYFTYYGRHLTLEEGRGVDIGIKEHGLMKINLSQKVKEMIS